MVNVAGKRASLSHLNQQLSAVPGVQDCVFVAPEDDGSGRTGRLVAFAVAPGLAIEAVMAALRQVIDPAFLPRPLHLVAALPRNELGKLPRQAIVRLLERVGEA
jgi:acyl-coenzyme A synthetase/AMP-(fatty) acid ligase